jgi:hypothetical protein
MFADDLLLFTKPNIKSVTNVFTTFQIFNQMTGLNINKSKSQISIAGVSNVIFQNILHVSGLQAIDQNAMHLGAPMCKARITNAQCLPLYEKITNKLNNYNGTKISQAGRLVIIQSVASAMCAYFFKLFIIPYKLINMLNRAFNHFLWHGNIFSTKLIPIAYKKIIVPLNKGGLGIINLKLWNIATTSQLVNKLLSSSMGMWEKWNRHYNLRGGNYWTMEAKNSDSFLWKKLLANRSYYLPMVQCNTVNSFWYSPWCAPGMILSHHIDYILLINSGIPINANANDFFIDGVLQLPHVSSTELNNLWSTITDAYKHVDHGGISWNGIHHSISIVYRTIIQIQHDSTFPWHTRIWKSGSKQKHNLLLWKCLMNAIHTQDNLVRRQLIDHSLCILCNRAAENVGHLFFNCHFSFQLWKEVLHRIHERPPHRDFKLEWIRIFHLTRWKTISTKRILSYLKLTIAVIWDERNLRRFARSSSSLSQLLLKIPL